MTRARCLKIFRRLSAYLDGDLRPNLCKEIERHMKGCDNCCAFFNTFKKTVELCKTHRGRPIPMRIRRQSLMVIRRQLRAL